MTKLILATVLLFASLAKAAASEPQPGQTANRLIKESSPYLRQHAYNPVDWYPWGKEAFEKAKRENKPILLSVGYSTCHWCHVMARESYSDKDIAKILNEQFVAIKVDRERRPDVDETYILATEIAAGQAGWPNNVFLTPDLKPFVGGTYFPPDAFKQLLAQISLRWVTDETLLRQEGDRIAGLVHRIMTHRVAAADVTPEALTGIIAKTVALFDKTHGGVAGRQKFPRENLLLFLLDMAEKHGNGDALRAATQTLDAMIQGGIRDQVGGGFHRYTVDPKWVVPHFEKMLYNQAQIGRALVQAYRITSKERYKRAALELFDFVKRDMTATQGGFYSAYDADSKRPDGETEEGFFYLWTEDELNAALGKSDGAFANRVFGTTFEGNFEGSNILLQPKFLAEIALDEKTTIDVVAARLKDIKAKLRVVRAERAAPHRDDKQLTAWNGLMIRALAEGALTFRDKSLKEAALKAATFFWRDMGANEAAAPKGQAGLKRYFFDGKASLAATQPDYAMLALGFISVYDATRDKAWLQRAASLAAQMDKLFLDKKTNDYYLTAAGGGFYRPKVLSDGDIPSGSAAAVELYAKLARRELSPEHRAKSEAVLAAISGAAMQQPTAYAYALRAADELLRSETGSERYIARGRVRIRAQLQDDGETIKVAMSIADGWHINAHKPLEDYFIPTVIAPSRQADTKQSLTNPVMKNAATAGSAAELVVTYPKPLEKKLGFNEKPLALYEGDIDLTARLQAAGPVPAQITLTAQTCSDEICLEPETINLAVIR